MLYYGQNGEDYIVHRFFKKSRGFFIEIGALDGVLFSNTLVLEKIGWDGICIEPHPNYFGMLKINRPKSTCIKTAASDIEGTSEFFAEPSGLFSSLIKSNTEDPFLKVKMEGFRKINVQTRSMNNIIKNYGQKRKIDFLSVDVEGAELKVLKGLNLSKNRPRIMIVEANTTKSIKDISKLLFSYGYYRSIKLASNYFFCIRPMDAIKLMFIKVKCTTIIPVKTFFDDGDNLNKAKKRYLNFRPISFSWFMNEIKHCLVLYYDSLNKK